MKIMELRVRRLTGPISTEDILPAQYRYWNRPSEELKYHLFRKKYPGSFTTLRPNDVLVNDDIIGVGTSASQIVNVLLTAGIRAIFAPSFGRDFYRACWNHGLFPVQVDEIIAEEGEGVSVVLEEGRISTYWHTYSLAMPRQELYR